MSTETDQEPGAVFRMPMRARNLEVGQFEGARCAVRAGAAGIGDPLEAVPEDLERAIVAVGAEHVDKPGRMLMRFADLPDGTLVWTQTGENEFRLGRLNGPWRYEPSGCFADTGIVHVRPAEWLEPAIETSSTPGGVVDTFARGGRNLQRINDAEAERISTELWRSRSGNGQG